MACIDFVDIQRSRAAIRNPNAVNGHRTTHPADSGADRCRDLIGGNAGSVDLSWCRRVHKPNGSGLFCFSRYSLNDVRLGNIAPRRLSHPPLSPSSIVSILFLAIEVVLTSVTTTALETSAWIRFLFATFGLRFGPKFLPVIPRTSTTARRT